MILRPIFTLIIAILLISGCQKAPQGTNPYLAEKVVETGESEDVEAVIEQSVSTTTTGVVQEVAISTSFEIEPDFIMHDVVFGSQAPYGVWDELHKEACEEASMVMVNNYFKNIKTSPHSMEQGILSLVKWQDENGYKIDLTIEETADILKEYFSLEGTLIKHPTVNDVKEELISGNLVIMPVAGREIGNPYFQTPGPIFHMLVIIGFDDKTGEFITNDPGTRRGQKFRYKYQTLLSAVHNWDHDLALGGMTDEEMAQGSQIILSVNNLELEALTE